MKIRKLAPEKDVVIARLKDYAQKKVERKPDSCLGQPPMSGHLLPLPVLHLLGDRGLQGGGVQPRHRLPRVQPM